MQAISGPVKPTLASTKRSSASLLLATSARHHGFEDLHVEGQLPSDLCGTLYRNGPGLFEVGGVPYAHPFEADGAITALRLQGGRASGAHQILETPELARERAANRHLHGLNRAWHKRLWGSYFGTQKNTANTSTFFHQGELYALMEGGRPTRVDQNTLARLGESSLEGALGSTFSAHPHAVPARKTTYNFGVTYGRRSTLTVYAMPEAEQAYVLTRVTLEHGVMLHDFIATEKHLVWFVSPAKLSVARFAVGLADFNRLFQWDAAAGTEVIVIPIDDPAAVRRFRVPAFFQWHFANAFERGSELVIDYMHFDDFSVFRTLGHDALVPGKFQRAIVTERDLRIESRSALPCEFPQVHPAFHAREARVTWAALQDAAGGIVRFDEHGERTFRFDTASRVSEAVVVPKASGASEDDVYLIALVLDDRTQKSFFAVWDGPTFERGPVTKAWFDHASPITFHGTWVSA